MSESSVVVIWGAGRLGLGLVGERAHLAGLPVALALRSDSSRSRVINECLMRHQEYFVVRPSERVRVPCDRVFWGDTDKGRAALIKLLVETETVFFAVAARFGQLDAVPVIHQAVQARRGAGVKGMFYLVPCENEVLGSFEQLKIELHGQGFCYVDMMVDRICTNRAVRKGRVEVVAEDPFEWAGRSYMRETGNRAAFRRDAASFRALGIFMVDDIDEFEAVKIRKRYLMNGVHTSLALLAKDDARDSYIEHLKLVPDDLDSVSKAYAEALSLRVPAINNGDLEETRLWFAKRIEASFALQGGDDIARTLSRLKPNLLDDYLRDIASKVAEAYVLLAQARGPAAAKSRLRRALEVSLLLPTF